MDENKEVTKFDPSTLMDGVKAKIKSAFVELMPEEAWINLVKGEQDKFFHKRQINKGSTHYPQWESAPSEFEEMVLVLMREECKKQLTEIFAKPEFKIDKIWANNPNTSQYSNQVSVTDHMEQMIKDKMPDMFMAMMKDMMGHAFHDFFSNINTRLSQIGMRM